MVFFLILVPDIELSTSAAWVSKLLDLEVKQIIGRFQARSLYFPMEGFF